MEYTVHTVTGEDDQRWPWSWSTLEQCQCASRNSAHPSHLGTQWTHTRKAPCNRKPSPLSLWTGAVEQLRARCVWCLALARSLTCFAREKTNKQKKNILSKSVCVFSISLFFYPSLPSCRRSVARMQAVVSLRHHSCVDGSCSHSLTTQALFFSSNRETFFCMFILSFYPLYKCITQAWRSGDMCKKILESISTMDSCQSAPVIHAQMLYAQGTGFTHRAQALGTGLIMAH